MGQGILGFGVAGISGLPANVNYGDTLKTMGVWLVNQGVLPVSNVLVSLVADPNNAGSPFQIGTIDLTGGILQPGDSTYVPLDYFVVTPQNSNQGSNIMVIWPTAVGGQPNDSVQAPYNVGGTTAAATPLPMQSDITVWPNPVNETLNMRVEGYIKPYTYFQIVDMRGFAVYRAPLAATQTVETFNLVPGTYFLVVLDDKEALLFSHKMVVKR